MLKPVQKILNNVSIAKKGIMVVAIPLVILLITIVLLAWYEKESTNAHDKIKHTLEVKATLSQVQSLVADSETAIRGYRLWNDRQYLEPYHEAKTQITPLLKKLSDLISDNTEQRSRIAALERNVTVKMDLIEQALGREKPTSINAPSVVLSRESMLNIRQLITEMDNMESVLLEKRNREYRNVTQKINTSIVLLFILGTVGGVAAAYIKSTSIVDRVSNLQDYANKVQTGEAATWTDSGKDEIGDLGRSLNFMTQSLLSREHLLHEAEKELKEANKSLEVLLEEARSANQELESFSYSVSHDLRAPLRHVAGFSQLMLKNAENLDSKNRRYLDIIINSIQQMGVLIDDLLAFSRMGRTSIKSDRIDLNHVINEVFHRLSPDISNSPIEWKVEPLPVIKGDPAMIQLVFQNLISNAIKYSRKNEKPVISVTASPVNEAGFITITFEDNGVGFDMKYVDKLFGVFQRLHHGEDYEGTGIGLANVRRIVHRHGGKVSAEGEVNRGARFTIALPAYTEDTSENMGRDTENDNQSDSHDSAG